MKKVSVVGAGFAGLTVALRLAQRGFQVDLYEKSSRVGGLLGTDVTDYGIAERAANALINSEKSQQLFQELGLTPSLPLKSSSRRFLFRNTPRRWPLSAVETLGFLSRLVLTLLRGRKALHPRAGETLKNWGLRNLGPSATQFILEPAMQGIYGNEISGLSARLILGPLFVRKKKKSRYKGLLTGPGGMQDLVNHLEAKCRELGVNIHLNTSVPAIDLGEPLIVATSASAAAAFLKERAPATANILSGISMSSLMSVTLFFKTAQTSFQGFGCLIPRGQNLRALGILMNSYIFKDRDKTYNETWILGGQQNQELLQLSDSALLQLIAEERFRILGHKETLLNYRINRWEKALPYYNLELEKALDELTRKPPEKGLYLHGNYLSGIGLSKILERSDLLAEEIARIYG